jgi:hypothetical protein
MENEECYAEKNINVIQMNKDTVEQSTTWSLYYANSFEYFTGDGNLEKRADGPLIDLIPTALKDIFSDEVTDPVSPSPIGLHWTIKTAVPVNGTEINDSSLESLLENNLTAGATELAVDAQALSDVNVDIESNSYVVLSEDDEELQVAVPVTSEDERGTSTTGMNRQTLAIIIIFGTLIIFIIIYKLIYKLKRKNHIHPPYPYPYKYPYKYP